MKRAKNFNMDSWQEEIGNGIVESEDELHACGNAACFAGYIAVSPEFAASGGRVRPFNGAPILQQGKNSFGAQYAVAEWLGVSLETAENLCALGFNVIEEKELYSEFYDKPVSKIVPQDVIQKLEELLATE